MAAANRRKRKAKPATATGYRDEENIDGGNAYRRNMVNWRKLAAWPASEKRKPLAAIGEEETSGSQRNTASSHQQ